MGRIGISGSVLFSLNSDELQDDGRDLLRSLVKPLEVYLDEKDELLMVSGFTDDLAIQEGNYQFDDNWDLSAQRALTVTRALVAEGMKLTVLPQRLASINPWLQTWTREPDLRTVASRSRRYRAALVKAQGISDVGCW